MIVDREAWLRPQVETLIIEVGRSAQFVSAAQDVVRHLGDPALRVEAVMLEPSMLDAELVAYLMDKHAEVRRIMLGARGRTPDAWFDASLTLPITTDALRRALDLR